jgi:hypothetical protein
VSERERCWVCQEDHEVVMFGPLRLLSCPRMPRGVDLVAVTLPKEWRWERAAADTTKEGA